MTNIVRKLARFIIPIGLIALGVNGLYDVSLQRDMTAKTAQLDASVSAAKTLSGRMHTSLSSLSVVAGTTNQMNETLSGIQANTKGMANGLRTLSSTVQGLESTIQQLGRSAGTSNAHVRDIETTTFALLSTLSAIQAANEDVSGKLSTMIRTESSMNQDLTQMNQKLAALP